MTVDCASAWRYNSHIPVIHHHIDTAQLLVAKWSDYRWCASIGVFSLWRVYFGGVGEIVMRIAMVGTGYVGLVSGACLADFGHIVTCVDKDASKIGALSRGEIPIYELGLQGLVGANTAQRRLSFTTELLEAVRNSEAVFIAVGTPSRSGDGHTDLSYVYEAAREIAAGLDNDTVVIIKSTVPVGTGDEVEQIIATSQPRAH